MEKHILNCLLLHLFWKSSSTKLTLRSFYRFQTLLHIKNLTFSFKITNLPVDLARYFTRLRVPFQFLVTGRTVCTYKLIIPIDYSCVKCAEFWSQIFEYKIELCSVCECFSILIVDAWAAGFSSNPFLMILDTPYEPNRLEMDCIHQA